jgi:uncharacterized Zn-binding protein involved in type VI secretion
MGQPAAKLGDKVIGTDIHKATDVVSGSTSDVPVQFMGDLELLGSPNVFIDGKAAAVVGQTMAVAKPPHVPPPGMVFTVPPMNNGVITKRPGTVLINNKPAARIGDTVDTCNVSGPAPTSTIVPGGPATVFIGG